MLNFYTIFFCILLITILPYYSSGYSQNLFAGDFRAPKPPTSIVAEYQASYVQHKWDGTDISHISTGMIYASLEVQRLRMDVIYEGIISSSLFDYAKINSDGTVPNYIYALSPTTAITGSCAHYNVTPAYPLFPPTVLADYQATFAGLVIDDLFYADKEPLQVWDILFGEKTSAKVFLANNTLVRMDFSSPERSTFTTTRLFNIKPGTPASNLFSNPCPPNSPTPTPATSGGNRNY